MERKISHVLDDFDLLLDDRLLSVAKHVSSPSWQGECQWSGGNRT